MGGKRSAVMCFSFEICVKVFVGIVLISGVRLSSGATNPADVAAINSLYVALESPPIPGWQASGGDPCSGPWQGVLCKDTNIVDITLVSANLGGELGNDLGSFSSIVKIDFSNNHIGGSIPTNLPVTLQNLVLPSNQLTGNLPDSLSSLTQLSAMSLDHNLLSGELPDAFHGLTALVNLDLSYNNLSGKLPSSVGDLSSLTTLHVQNNQLSGTLDVLQDLPLSNLNVENNLFNGPIPDKMQSIPNFKKDGNPFSTTVASPPPPGTPTTPPPPPVHRSPSSGLTPGRPSNGSTPGKPASGAPPPEEPISKTTKKNSKTKKVALISVVSVFLFLVLLLALLLFIPRCHKRWRESDRIARRREVAPDVGNRDNPIASGALAARQSSQTEKDPEVAVARLREEHQIEPRKTGWTQKSRNEPERNVQNFSALPKRNGHQINPSRSDIDSLMPPPPPPPPRPLPPPAEVAETSMKTPIPPLTVKSFTIAALQQFTNSFSPENLIGEGMLGAVYKAELPDGKLLAVKKLSKEASTRQKEEEFLELVKNIDKIRHANVVELMGYCTEHGQRLLIYEYCGNGTLQDALHSEDESRKQLSWNARIRMALGAARALEYLHEICEPPVIHRNFRSANVLLDDELAVHVSDCGLGALISSKSVTQLSGHLLTTYAYGAPEFESGIYTLKSDVFWFGVVMLELLTGRKSYDSSRNREEQFLVRWAIPQLHDIGALSSMVDPSLNGEYPIKAISHFVDIISRCVLPEPEFRPQMSEVVQDLLQIIRRESPPRLGED